MENVQDWAAYFLDNPNLAANVPPSYLSYFRRFLSYTTMAKSYILPLIDQVSRKPDLATIALLLIIIFVSLKILNMLANTFLFWFRMLRIVAFWGGLVGLALWMYSRGPAGVGEDVGYWWGVWSSEYENWKAKERAARLLQEQVGQQQQRQQRWY